MNQKLRIRPASVEDTGVVLDFIRRLAEYEKLSDEVVAQEAELKESLFGSKPAAEVILAEFGDRAVGFALFFTSFSTFLGLPGIWLEDLFVLPESRGQGVGKHLLAHLGGLVKSRGWGRLEWAVLDWNESAIKFYESLGARPQEEWTTWRMSGTALEQMAGSRAGCFRPGLK